MIDDVVELEGDFSSENEVKDHLIENSFDSMDAYNFGKTESLSVASDHIPDNVIYRIGYFISDNFWFGDEIYYERKSKIIHRNISRIDSTGMPDLLCWKDTSMYRGSNDVKFYFVEIKLGEDSLSKNQIKWMEKYSDFPIKVVFA